MNVSPVLALAGLIAIGLLVTHLPRPVWRLPRGLPLALTAGGLPVLAGLVLGPGIGFLDARALRALAPVTALALGWIGATLGARFEWRRVRRLPRGIWLPAALGAAAASGAVALGAVVLARVLPGLAAAWTPRVPAVLTLAAVAAASGPGAVTLAARAARLRPRLVRTIARTAALETGAGVLAAILPLALRPPHLPAPGVSGVFPWFVLAVGSGALVGMVLLSVSRHQVTRATLAVALLATVAFGAGIGYAADLSPFVVCGLAAGLAVNASPQGHAIRQLLAEWERPMYGIVLVAMGAILTLPTPWLLLAGPLLAGMRVAAKGALGQVSQLLGWSAEPPEARLATVGQGGAALALGLNFFLLYSGGSGGESVVGSVVGGARAAGALVTTVVLAVAVAELVAPLLLVRAARAGPGLAALTPRPGGAELSRNASGA